MDLVLKSNDKMMNIMKEITQMTRKMELEFGKEIMDRSTSANGKII